MRRGVPADGVFAFVSIAIKVDASPVSGLVWSRQIQSSHDGTVFQRMADTLVNLSSGHRLLSSFGFALFEPRLGLPISKRLVDVLRILGDVVQRCLGNDIL